MTDLATIATVLLVLFVLARLVLAIPPIRRLVDRLLVGREGEME